MNNWKIFYQDRVNPSYYQHVQTKYGKFINLIDAEIQYSQDIVVELGCGICNITRRLASMNHKIQFIAIDKDYSMLELSIQNLASDDNLSNIDLRRGDILNDNEVPYGTIAHSHGVLEHFTDFQLRRIIDIQIAKYKTLIHYVPSYKYQVPSFGDERLLTADQWNNIIHPHEIVSFNDGYDYALIWRK